METSSGFLRAKVSLARPGVFEYTLPDGKTRKEAKLPEDRSPLSLSIPPEMLPSQMSTPLCPIITV